MIPPPPPPLPRAAAPPSGAERRAAELRLAAATLRHEATAVAEAVTALGAYDRPDVWQGAVADAYRLRHDELRRRLGSPWSGAVPALLDAADRLERRADWSEMPTGW